MKFYMKECSDLRKVSEYFVKIELLEAERSGLKWVIDDGEDVDAFLEQLFLVNEQSLSISPSLDTFCMSLSINTTEHTLI